MKKILITQRTHQDPATGEIREALDTAWGTFFRECGILAVPVSSEIPVRTLFKEIHPDGILFSGGNDLEICNPGNILSKTRDLFESRLLEHAMTVGVPVLGVCRGMQMIGHYFGSKLEKVEGHVATRHEISISPGSFLSPIYGEQIQVNSYHNFGITDAGKTLRICARSCSDKTIEAIAHPSHRIAGIMWHPEREKPYNSFDLKLIQSFFCSSPK